MRKMTLNLVLPTLALLVIIGCRTTEMTQVNAPLEMTSEARPGMVPLVVDGKSVAPIVVFEGAPRFTRQAVDELADYIEEVSGAKPEVIEGEPDPIPKHAIWVGYQPVVKRLFPDVDFEFKHPEEILIAANDNHLVIAGRDRWNPDNMKQRREGMDIYVNGVQSEYGTINALNTFLRDCLGIRWLWPGELGEDVPKSATIAFAPFEYRYHPRIRSRRGLFTMTRVKRMGFRPDSDGQSWVRHQRLLLDSMAAPGGHAFKTWWKRFHDIHPEYFALQPDGTRGRCTREDCVKLCHSNPEVWKQWLNDVETQRKDDPTLTVFNASPNDGFNQGHCVCEACRLWDHPDGEKLRFSWKGSSQEYPALTDRHLTFANIVARMLKQKYPDKDFYVSMSAYGNWRPPPVAVKPDDNVVISVVANFHNKKFSGRNELTGEAEKRLSDWAKVAPAIVWRPNLGTDMWQSGLPKVDMDRAVRDLRVAADNHVVGVFFDKLFENWATQGPHYYMLAHMTWNPQVDADAIMKDYYQRGFGKAADDVEAYWTFLTETTRKILAARESTRWHPPWWQFYDEAFFESAQSHLDRAKVAVKNEPQIYRDRVEFVQTGLDYTRALTDVRNLMERLRKSDGKDQEAKKQAMEIWTERIHPLVVNKRWPYAFNAMYIRPNGGRALRRHQPEELAKEWPINRWLDYETVKKKP